MTYSHTTGDVTAIWRPHTEVPSLVRPVSSVRFVAPGSITRGQFGLFDWEMKPNAKGAVAHYHNTFSESFYIVQGRVELYNGEKWTEAGPGDFLHVPAGGIHGFRNMSNQKASMLILFAPGISRELFFQELAEIDKSGRQLSSEEWTELYRRHDQHMV